MSQGQNEFVEQRVHPRYSVQERALILLEGGSQGMPYHMVEVSKGGLSFRYLGENQLDEDISEVSILWRDELLIEKIPVRAVSDTVLDRGYITLRRLGVRFDNITSAHKEQLADFIEEHTTGKI